MSRVTSPCVNVCRMDEARRLCKGCGRTLDEIARWGAMSEDERRSIMARLPGRAQPAHEGPHEGRHGGPNG